MSGNRHGNRREFVRSTDSMSSWVDLGDGIDGFNSSHSHTKPKQTQGQASASGRSAALPGPSFNGSSTPKAMTNHVTGYNTYANNVHKSEESDNSDAEVEHFENVEDQLTRSLDLGHGSFQRSNSNSTDYNAATLTCDEDWFNYNESKANSLPHSGYFTLRSGMTKGRDHVAEEKPEALDQGEKIKTKLMSAWNNMRHGWTMRVKTSFKYDSPVWLLGRCYESTASERDEAKRLSRSGIPVHTSMERFKRDFTSRLWFTYRQDFPALQGTLMTTDVGWGCMLRSGQMMVSQALVTHFLGREWRWYPHQKQHEVIYHHQIVRFFGDLPIDECPFSLHRLVKIGKDHGKKPGDWYGPASVAYVLRDAMEQAPEFNPILGQICLYVAQDCTVYKQDVYDLCTRVWPNSRRSSVRNSVCSNASDVSTGDLSAPSEMECAWRPCLILIPVRLGGEGLNPVYIPCVQSILAHDMCIGIIGGKPKHSVYFVGWQDDKVIYLDPHFCQDLEDVKRRDFDLTSFHCMSPRKMSFSKMDPSCTIGFYCKTRLDFENFVREASKFAAPPKEKGQYPMFVFQEGRSIDVEYACDLPEERVLRVRHLDHKGRVKHGGKEVDDFVFL